MKKFGGEQAFIAGFTGAEFAGESVEIDGGEDGLFGLFGELGEESGEHAGEDIAAAAFAHGGGAGGVDVDLAIGQRDEGALPFEDEDDVVFGRVGARGADAIGLDFGGGFAGEAGHLAGMRSEHTDTVRAAG